MLHDCFRHTHTRDLKPLLFGFDDPRENVCRVEILHENSLSSRSFFSAAPLSIASAAAFSPSFQVLAAPPATMAGAEFKSTTSRHGPRSPANTDSMIFAFSAASAP